jgi:hypothetical protein
MDFTVKPRGYKNKLQNVSNEGRKNGGDGVTQPYMSAFVRCLAVSSGTPAKSIEVYIRTSNAVVYIFFCHQCWNHALRTVMYDPRYRVFRIRKP